MCINLIINKNNEISRKYFPYQLPEIMLFEIYLCQIQNKLRTTILARYEFTNLYTQFGAPVFHYYTKWSLLYMLTNLNLYFHLFTICDNRSLYRERIYTFISPSSMMCMPFHFVVSLFLGQSVECSRETKYGIMTVRPC